VVGCLGLEGGVGRTKAQREHCVYYLVGKRRSGKQSRHLGVFSFLFFCFIFFDSCSFFFTPSDGMLHTSCFLFYFAEGCWFHFPFYSSGMFFLPVEFFISSLDVYVIVGRKGGAC